MYRVTSFSERNFLKDYLNLQFLLDSNLLSNALLKDQNIESLQQDLAIFDTYFSNLEELFDYWRNL